MSGCVLIWNYDQSLDAGLQAFTDLDGGELTEAYAVENGEVKMSKQELIAMIENAGFEALEREYYL